MASHLSCIGFEFGDRTEFETVVGRLAARGYSLGAADGVEVVRWEDPSGARLVLGRRQGEYVDLLPSFAGSAGVNVARCRALSDEVVLADVVDADGEQITTMAFELEQRRALVGGWSGLAAVTAFGMETQFFADEDEFAASPKSLLDPDDGPDEPAPAHAVEYGLRWPPRMAAESFISFGGFGDHPVAEARLNGTVLRAARRRNTETGRRFLAARVGCLGFEVDLVTEWDAAPAPVVGSIAAVGAFLVASIDSLAFDEGPRAAMPRRRRPWMPHVFRRG
ncbi:hypothetical protein [Microbacterium sp. 13-71-7]|uniref:hypothetical protein n=1 Tax=Microbacterium sp. 13-71-7 TaxID=1970399 RepID=UPI000BDDE144|nr:hypothetical protein [Microbacterium sp. 13-71-7]OZB82145.1 MAG: hypothetical protein B7X32_14585 [Microbacterium sp. 13-71-7]